MDCDWEFGENFTTFLSMGMIAVFVVTFFSYHIGICIWQTTSSPIRTDDYYYEGPFGVDSWTDNYPMSQGFRQSPINITSSLTIEVPSGKDLVCENFSEKPVKLQLHNEGHTAWILGSWLAGKQPQISGGPLTSQYIFQCLAFRWAPGAEHSFNYERSDLEAQLIFLREGVQSLTEASSCNRRESMVILSYCYNITPVSNPFLEHVIRGLSNIVLPHSLCEIEPRPISWIAPSFNSDYYCYKGSLTFPPCAEIVIWILQPEPLGLSQEQLFKFKQLQNNLGHTMACHSRPLQSINDREIRYFK